MKRCGHCGIDFSRNTVLVATIINSTEKRLVLEVTEVQDRKLTVKGETAITFPFIVGDGEDIPMCSLNCYKGWLKEATERNEKIKR